MGKTRQSANLVSNNNIFVDIVNDRVGIKTDSPAYDLDVKGNINLSGTLYQDGSEFTSASGVGIQSAGTTIGAGITQLNFIGMGNTFAVNGSTVDISISGSGGAGLSTTGFSTSYGIHIDPVGAGVTYSEDLVVVGNARVTGILSIGTSSIVLNSSDNSIKLSSDAIIRRDESTGDIRFLDSGGNLKKIIANEIRVGSGDDATLIKRRGGKVVFEDSSGESVSVGKTWTSIASGVVTTLSANTQYLVDTSSGVTTTYLPASPQLGEYIVIADSKGSFGINTCFIVQNDSATGPATYIHGSLEYLEADVQYAHATLTYTGISTTGWLVK